MDRHVLVLVGLVIQLTGRLFVKPPVWTDRVGLTIEAVGYGVSLIP